jgi:hypothetical protein
MKNPLFSLLEKPVWANYGSVMLAKVSRLCIVSHS